MADPTPTFYKPDARYDIEGGNRELYEAGKLLYKTTFRMSGDPEFDFEHVESDDRKDHLDNLADELDRVVEQLNAVPLVDTVEDKVRTIASKELTDAADILRSGAQETIDLGPRAYMSYLVDTHPYTEEGLIVYNFLRVAGGAHISGSGWYLNEKGEFGFSNEDRFRVDPLLDTLKQSLKSIKDALLGPNEFDAGAKDQVLSAGQALRSAFETIMKTMDMTQGDPLEKAFRLISVKLEMMIAIIMDGLNLTDEAFQSPIFEKVRTDELEGHYGLKRLENRKSFEHITVTSELEDAIALMELAKRIATTHTA